MIYSRKCSTGNFALRPVPFHILTARRRVDISRPPASSTGGSLPWSGSTPDVHPSSFDFLTAHLQLPRDHPTLPYARWGETSDEIYDKVLACEQFLSFFQYLSLQRREFSLRKHSPRVQNLLSTVLGQQSTLFRLLAENPKRIGPGAPGIRYSKDHCCLACLLLLNIALWDYADRPRTLEKFLKRLDQEVRSRNLEHNRSVETLLWIFWKDGEIEFDEDPVDSAIDGEPIGVSRFLTHDACERNWLVTRLLRMAKRLNHVSWEMVRTTLLTCLLVSQAKGGSTSGGTREGSLQWNRMYLPWNDDDLRKAILGDLYSGPPPLKLDDSEFG